VTGGFIPTYYPPRARVLRGRLAKLRDGGIGALMAVRRDAALAVGGFDERVGAGSDLAACEDGELAYRLLRAGWGLAHVPAASVMHHGFRRWADGRRYSYDTYRGIGAAYATHLRGGDPGGLALLAQQFAVVLGGMVRAALQREPIGLARLLGLGAGVVMGVRMQPWGTAPRRPAAWSQ